MSKASSLYRCLSKTIFSPAKLLNILNNEICETTTRGMFVTMLIGIYDSNIKELTLANAGHEPPLLYSKNGNFSNFEEAGPPLGIAQKFKFKETKINFSNSSMYIFTDGITDDSITNLSLWKTFPVISRNSSFTYKGKSVKIKEVAEELGVQYIVEGSVRKGGNKVRITAQLIDCLLYTSPSPRD